MHRNRLIVIVVVVFAIIGATISYALYFSRISINNSESKAIEISKQTSTVQQYLSQHHNAECEVRRYYVESNGSVYKVDSQWELEEYIGASEKPIDGKDHYCWTVVWYEPAGGIPHVIYVFIDKDNWEIVSVVEAW